MAEPTAAEVMATHLEPEAVKGIGIREETVLTASIAISLKRIADAMERGPNSMFGLEDEVPF